MTDRRFQFISEDDWATLNTPDVGPQDEKALEFLHKATFGESWLIHNASNYTFLVELNWSTFNAYGIYKPQMGEFPLWDFPDDTLYLRECSAYEVSEMLGWGIVPPTVYREGEFGIGSLQLYVPPIKDSNYFSFRAEYPSEALRMAVFDVIINNADRKGGHCFEAQGGGVWGIDHGLTFHPEHKLRTVIWDFAEQEIPSVLLEDIRTLKNALDQPKSTYLLTLGQLLMNEEIEALRARLEGLLKFPILPRPMTRRDLPWPLL